MQVGCNTRNKKYTRINTRDNLIEVKLWVEFSMLQYQIHNIMGTVKGMECSMSTDMQANTRHHPSGLVQTGVKQTLPTPSKPLPWGKWETYH